MTIQSIIGAVDVFSAAVAIGIIVCVGVIVTTALARTPRRKLDMDFKLAQMKQQLDHDERKQNNEIAREKALAGIASTREIEFKRIDSGMVDVKSAGRHPEDG